MMDGDGWTLERQDKARGGSWSAKKYNSEEVNNRTIYLIIDQ